MLYFSIYIDNYTFIYLISFNLYTDHAHNTICGTNGTCAAATLYNGVLCNRSNKHDVAQSWKSTHLFESPYIQQVVFKS